jgi:hypothetical protein
MVLNNSTFNIPAIQNGDTPLGVNTVALFGHYTNGSIPNIIGQTDKFLRAGAFSSGVFYGGESDYVYYYTPGNSSFGWASDIFDASRSSNVYQNDETFVKSCGTYMYYVIKY